MFAYIKGVLASLDPQHAVLDCHGVGYQLRISLNTYSALTARPAAQQQEPVRLWTHLQIKEDAHLLFGFAETQERALFEQLIGISGVGGTTALLILSRMRPDDLRRAIAEADLAALKSIKGIGEKTAGRILLELKNKLPAEFLHPTEPLPTPVVGPDGTLQPTPATPAGLRAEAAAALLALGFARPEVDRKLTAALAQLTGHDGTLPTLEALIKAVLRSSA